MALSEQELRLLEQMERALVEDDPKLASTLRGTAFRRNARRKVIAAGLVFVIGVAVLLAGAVTGRWYVGIVGFVLMLGAATIGLGAMRSTQSSDARGTAASEHPSGFSVVEGGKSRRTKSGGRGRGRGNGPKAPLMERMEERWRRRRETGGY